MDIQAKVSLLVNSTNNVKAMASITIDNAFVITGIKIIEGVNGMFTSMPQRKTANGEYKDICFPITADARAEMQNEILKAYEEKLGGNTNDVPEYQNSNDFSDLDLPF